VKIEIIGILKSSIGIFNSSQDINSYSKPVPDKKEVINLLDRNFPYTNVN